MSGHGAGVLSKEDRRRLREGPITPSVLAYWRVRAMRVLGTSSKGSQGSAADNSVLTWAKRALVLMDAYGGDDSHPEHRCERCAGRNITWFCESGLWNRVARADGYGILCPICFVRLAENKGEIPPSWRLSMLDEDPR